MTSHVGALTGYTIGITGHRRWDEQAEMLTRRGAEVIHGRVMQTNLLHDADATIDATPAALRNAPDLVVLTTGIGTRSWFAAAETAGRRSGPGPGPARWAPRSRGSAPAP